MVCKALLHHAAVTRVDPAQRIAIGIDAKLLDRSAIGDGERVHVWNENNGRRLEMDVVRLPAAGRVEMRGGAARHFQVGDRVIIAGFGTSAAPIAPSVVFIDGDNAVADPPDARDLPPRGEPPPASPAGSKPQPPGRRSRRPPRPPAAPRHLLSLKDVSPATFLRLIDRSLYFGAVTRPPKLLAGRTVGTYFVKTSTRTRTAFTVAAARLGAAVMAIRPDELQTCTGETLADTARVLSGYLDALVVRTAGPPSELRELAAAGRLAVINAMTSDEHPTQALSDFTTIKHVFGGFAGVRLLYVGEGNNTAAALANGAARCAGFDATFVTPEGYGIDEALLADACARAAENGAQVRERHDMAAIDGTFDVVYTTRWQTTGTVKRDADWRRRFAPFRVSTELMAAVSKPAGTIFMHDLPAVRGEDCDAHVLDGPQSVAFEQARQKLYSAMSVLEWCLT